MSVSTDKRLDKLEIAGIAEPTVIDYFMALNDERFADVAALFAEEGVLRAPFETPLVGREAIANYLEAEAKGMILCPNEGIVETLEDNCQQFKVSGKVKTALFSVNVSWLFIINSNGEINSARVKLLASPEELLKLRRQ